MPDYTFVDGWVIRETAYKPEEESARATIFALANGYMGTRGAGEELSPEIPGVKGTCINGIYDMPNGKLTEREFANIQDWTFISFTIDGEQFDLSKGKLIDYCRELDMRGGMIRRKIVWQSLSGKTATVESERLLCMAPEHLHLAVIRWKLSIDQAATITLTSAIDAAVNNRWAYHFKEFSVHPEPDGMYLEAKTFNPGYDISVLSRHELDGPREICQENRMPNDRRAEYVCKFELTPGETAALTKWTSVYESRFGEGNLRQLCREDLNAAIEMGYGALRRKHTDRWAELWKASDVVIEGDDDAQMGIRFSVFHLLASAPYHDGRISIPARGLQGQDYYGSVFWDCEIFTFPMFAYTQPQAARNILSYRYHTLDGARRKAAGMGFNGAYYAWQSQETGDDQCDLFVFDNPLTGTKIRSYFADEQIHISADIVYAMWQYYEAAGDVSFFCEGGAEIAVEVARFFISRAEYNKAKDRWEIRTVLGPDEYHEQVDNNAYTNALAAESIRRAIDIMQIVARYESEKCKQTALKLNVSVEEMEQWQSVLAKLYIPTPDPESKLIEQFDGYFQLLDEPVEETRRRLAHPDLHPGGPLGPFQETQNIKQADVIMLLYLLRDRYDEETKRRNWEYYEKRTAHDSSLSPMAYSLVAADVGMADWAYKYYMYTSHIDLESYGPHWNLGVHTASLGGAWLDIVHGFCQLSLKQNGIHIDKWPVLPPHWKSVRFNFLWHGHEFTYVTDGTAVEINSSAPVDVPIFFPGGQFNLRAGKALLRENLDRQIEIK